MPNKGKQSIYDTYNRQWQSNPTIRALGYNKDRYCTGLATTPKELTSLLINEECTGVVFLVSEVSFEEYDKTTGEKVESDTFYNGERFSKTGYVDYVQTIMETGFDLDKKEDIEQYDKRLGENSVFLDSLISYGFTRNIDVESRVMKVKPDVVNPFKVMYLKRGNILFCMTTNSLVIPVGIDSFMIVHDAYRDVDFTFLLDVISTGLVVKRSELKQELLKAFSLIGIK
ncbi:hypothetical protein P9X10_02335 [Bacillus cereus]|nr:hypothetical protein [Bacillus cereus]